MSPTGKATERNWTKEPWTPVDFGDRWAISVEGTPSLILQSIGGNDENNIRRAAECTNACLPLDNPTQDLLVIKQALRKVRRRGQKFPHHIDESIRKSTDEALRLLGDQLPTHLEEMLGRE